MMMLIFVLASIIGSSFIYSRNTTYREFAGKVRSFSEWPRIIAEAMGKPFDREIPRMKGGKWPREIIVIDEVEWVLKNDIINLDEKDTHWLLSIWTDSIIEMKIGGEDFLINRQKIWSTSVFLLEDMDRVYDFHIRLMVIALFWVIVATTVIYILARYLAHITITPIREHNKDLESYSHNVAHELRTPLSVMRSNIELMRLKNDEKFLDSTDDEITNMEHIIESLLFLAKPWMTKEEMKKLDIVKLSKECLEKYEERKSDIQFKIDETPLIYGEQELYKRMLSNLIENALKYKSEWKVEVLIGKGFLEIKNSIEENIPKEQIEKLTKSFYQLDTSRNTEWYGLGLSLVDKIVKIFHWKISLESKDSSFLVRISFPE